jgi:hypothetical protein
MTIDTSTLPTPTYTIDYNESAGNGIAPAEYTVTFDTNGAGTNYSTVTAPSTPISINVDKDVLGNEWHRKTFDNWPSEVIIEDMIKKYPGLKLQYDKFMTVYNLVKDQYEYEEPQNDGSI